MFVPTEAAVLHADLDAFFASVEQRDDPRLRDRPVIVGAGVVLAASYEARARGVRSAMGGGTARRLCPDAIVVPPRFDAYTAASRQVFTIFRRLSPVVEALSIDEAFLDVRGLERICGSPREIAVRLRHEVRWSVGLPITVGVATTKSLAKVASNEAKPDGLLVVEAGEEDAFLHPLPVERLWGVGPATTARLHAAGIVNVGDLAARGSPRLADLLGRHAGQHLHALAHHRDPRPVRRRPRRRSFGAQSALGRGSRSAADLDAILAGLVERVTRRMRAKGRVGRTVVLRLRFGDFTRATRSTTLADATATSRTVLATARGLLDAARPEIRARGLTLVGITVANIDDDGGAGQLELDLEHRAGGGAHALDTVLDEVRERYGAGAIVRATRLGRREAQPWLMPEEGDD